MSIRVHQDLLDFSWSLEISQFFKIRNLQGSNRYQPMAFQKVLPLISNHFYGDEIKKKIKIMYPVMKLEVN